MADAARSTPSARRYAGDDGAATGHQARITGLSPHPSETPSDEAPTPSVTKPSRLTSAPALLLRPALSSWVQMAAKR